MKNLTITLCLLISAFFLFSCGSQPETVTEESQEPASRQKKSAYSVDTSARPSDSQGTYLFKSAIIEFETAVMGMKQNMVMYIDDYGEKTAVEIKSDMMGQKTHVISVVKDGYEYALDMINKVMTKEPYIESPETDIDFTSLTEELMKELHLTYKGQEEFLGKMCDKFTLNNRTLLTTGTYWVWKGLPLKSEIKTAGMPINMTAKSIDTKTVIPDTIFEIPQGFILTNAL